MRPKRGRRAIFFDRDGVLNRLIPGGYVLAWDDFVWLPGAKEAIRQASAAGWLCAVLTNQSCIGRGLVTAARVREIHERMAAEIGAAGGRLSGVFVCPHHPEERCECRKPRPGLLLTAASALGLDLASSWLIGDSAADLEAATHVGVSTVLVRTGAGAEVARQHSDWTVADDVRGAVEWIIGGR